ncbi:MAG: DeoR/GlpR transcriptional regulator [Planctomycetes bacterium]|nr:DeoR/GlpR transcriptional regulator [Planctomycetota bacterium]
MLLDQRRERILQLVESKGFASLQELVEETGVSESTVRRDLEYLEGIRQIRRTRGGAAYVGESLTAFEERRTRALPQKQRIAKQVAEMVEPGEAILLDGGTTTLEVARQLVGKSLQVVTNSLPVVNLLVNQPQIELIVIGGYLYPKTGVALGPHAEAMLESIHVRRLIMSVGGITERGLFNSNSLLVETERRMMHAAEEVVVVADSSKFGHSALVHLCPLEAVDQMVVDSGISDTWQQRVREAGVKLTLV